MAINANSAVLDITGEYINRRFQEQTWYREHANFVTALGGFFVTAAAWLGTQSFADDPRVSVTVLLLGFLGTVLGVHKTKNGISKSQLKNFNEARSEYIGAQPLVHDSTVDLAAEVEAYNTRQE